MKKSQHVIAGNLMSCVERSSKLTHTVAAECWAAPWEVRTVTSTRADDSLSTLLLQLSVSLPLFHSYLLSLAVSVYSSLSPASVSSLAAFHQLSTCLPHSQLFRLSHTQGASSLPLISPPSLSLLPLSLSHTHMCSLLVTSFISTLFVCSQAYTHMMWHWSQTQNSKPRTPPSTNHATTTTLIPFKAGNPPPSSV